MACSVGAMVVLAGAPEAGAAGLLPTSTAVALSSSSIPQGQGITVSATVKPLNLPLGVYITPLGTVSFSATNGTTTDSLGSGSIPPCLALVVLTVTPCTVSVTSYPALTPGTWTISASYGGDAVMSGSTGKALLTVTADPFVQICTAEQDSENDGCNGFGFSDDPTTGNQTDLDVFQFTEGTDVINISFGGPTLSCSAAADTGGQIADFFTADTNPGDSKNLDYTVQGPAADKVNDTYPDGNAPLCYGSSNPFTTASGGPAPFVNGEYEGLLPFCTGEVSPPPCIENEEFTAGDPGHDAFDWYVFASGGDPRMGGGG